MANESMNKNAYRWVKQSAGIVVFTLISMMVVGCDRKTADTETVTTEDVKTSQVAAKVNGTEITVRQVEQRIPPAFLATATPEALQATKNFVLGQLINEQILVDKAKAEKLDRKPEVVDQIEAYRRRILIAAYLNQLHQTATEPTPNEIQAFYQGQADKYANNVRYFISQININYDGGSEQDVVNLITNSSNLRELTQALSAKGYQFTENATMVDTALLRDELIDLLRNTSNGSLLILGRQPNNRIVAGQLLRSESRPLTETVLRPLIHNRLIGQKRIELEQNEVQQLLSGANIEYGQGYAQAQSREELEATLQRSIGDPTNTVPVVEDNNALNPSSETITDPTATMDPSTETMDELQFTQP